MIFDIRKPLYPLGLMNGRAQTRRAWRLPLNGSRWATLLGEFNFRRATAFVATVATAVSFRRITILSITFHSKFPSSGFRQ